MPVHRNSKGKRRRLRANAPPELLFERVPLDPDMFSGLPDEAREFFEAGRRQMSDRYTPLAQEPPDPPTGARFPAGETRPDYGDVLTAACDVMRLLTRFLASGKDDPLFNYDVEALFRLVELGGYLRQYQASAREISGRALEVERLARIYAAEAGWPGGDVPAPVET